jgi:hypothetical protein
MSFVAYDSSNNDRYYMLTAGHCANNGSNWFHGPNNKSLGTMIRDSTTDGSTADAALVGPISFNNIQRWNYKTPTTVTLVLSRDSPFDDAQGDRVCLSAKMAEAQRCGQIVDPNEEIEIQPGVVLIRQREASYAWEFGDSGGAVFNGNVAVGIQSGHIGANATYSHIHYAQSRTNSWVNVSNCGNWC